MAVVFRLRAELVAVCFSTLGMRFVSRSHVMFSTTLCVLLVGLVGLRALDWQLVASALELEIYLINQVIDSMVWRIQGPFSPVLYFRIGFCAPLRSEAFSHLDRVFVLDC